MQTIKAKEEQQKTVFDEVREGFARVAALSTHVKIREDRIADYAEKLPDELPENTLDDKHHFKGTLADTVAYSLIVDSINFGSGYKPRMAEEGLKLVDGSIYFTITSRLKNYFETNGVPSAESLTKTNTEDIAAILGLNLQGSYSHEFADLCARSFRDLGQAVLDKAEGDYLRYVTDAAPSAANMVRRLAETDAFRDTHKYKGHQIPFYKRAQHNVTVLSLVFNSFGKQLFDDMDQVTMFADNAVPRILHADGILEYSDELIEKIKNGDFIPAGSEEEIELRACAGQAVELIARAKGMKAADIDIILWHNSVENPRYMTCPSHRTLSWFY